jgi:hypothetical membrane protein
VDKATSFPETLDRRVVLGAACWTLTVVFFVGQAIAQAGSKAPYSLLDNEISDLGVSTCGPISAANYHATVCSPLHVVMNATFVVTGLLVLLGAVATWRAWPRRRLSTVGLVLLVLAGAGQALAGLRPEDVNFGLHVLGAIFGIAGADVALILLGIAVWRARRWIGVAGVVLGALGIAGFLLMGSAQSLDVGTGALERVAGYPSVVWMIAVGVSLLRVGAEARPALR